MRIRPVVTPYDTEAVDDGKGVAQQVDACVVVELAGTRFSRVVFVVAQAGIDGCLDATELFGHVLFYQRPHAHINDVTGYEHVVGVLGIDHIDPASQLATWIMIAQVQVTHHDQRQGSCQWFVRRQGHLHTYLIIIMDIAIEEECEHAQRKGHRTVEILTYPDLGHEMYKATKVENQEDHDEIEQNEDAAVADVIDPTCQPQRQAVDDARKIEENHAERQHANTYQRPSPRMRQWHEHPHVPAYIGQTCQGQQEEKNHPHHGHIFKRCPPR